MRKIHHSVVGVHVRSISMASGGDVQVGRDLLHVHRAIDTAGIADSLASVNMRVCRLEYRLLRALEDGEEATRLASLANDIKRIHPGRMLPKWAR